MNARRVEQYESALALLEGRTDLVALDEAKEVLGRHTLVCKQMSSAPLPRKFSKRGILDEELTETDVLRRVRLMLSTRIKEFKERL